MNTQSQPLGRTAKSRGAAILKAGLVASALALAAPAHASLAGQQILGDLKFSGNPLNYYDPANNFVPAGYDNNSGPLVTVTPFGYSFGFLEDRGGGGFNRVGATFGDSAGGDSYLIFGALIFGQTGGMNPWEQTFTSSTPGLFTSLTLVSNNFVGLTYSLAGDTITLAWTGWPMGSEGDFGAKFIVHQDAVSPPPPPPPGVPEPASWALMILGFGGIGAMLRRSRTRLPARRAA